MAAATWGLVLTIAALIAVGLHIHRWRAQRITSLHFAAGLVARIGFVLLGVMYATDFAERWPRAPFHGLLVVGIGIVLNLVAGIVENIRRPR